LYSKSIESIRPKPMNSGATCGNQESLIRGYSGRVFLLVTFGVMVANLGRQALPPLLPNINETLAITPAAAGFALTVMRICVAVLQYPSGRIADEISRKTPIVGGLVILIIGFVVLTQVHTYFMFILSAVLLGVGSAFFIVSERVLLSDLFVDNRGLAFGTSSSISGIGSSLAAGLAVATLSIGPWQYAFIPVVTLLIGITVGFHVVSRERYGVSRLRQFASGDSQMVYTVRRVFGTTKVRWLLVAYMLIIFVWEGMMAFLPLYLSESKGFTTGIAGLGFATLFAVGVIVQPFAGSVSDRIDRQFVAVIATIFSIVGLSVLIVSQSFIPIITGVVLYAAGLMAFIPVVHAYLMDLFPEETKGADLGAFRTVYEGASSLGPTYVGVTVGIANYDTAFIGLLILLVISGTVLLWCRSIQISIS